MPQLADLKTKARQEARTHRRLLYQNLDPVHAGQKAANWFLHLFQPGSTDCIAAYWPSQYEFDSRPLLKNLCHLGARTALPVVTGPDTPLDFRLWSWGDRLQAGAYDIMIPDSKPQLNDDLLETKQGKPIITHIIVPLLAFDETGVRLGQGGGYYDRTIPRARVRQPAVQVVGLAFEGQKVDRVPCDALDAPLDGILTEAGWHPAHIVKPAL